MGCGPTAPEAPLETSVTVVVSYRAGGSSTYQAHRGFWYLDTMLSTPASYTVGVVGVTDSGFYSGDSLRPTVSIMEVQLKGPGPSRFPYNLAARIGVSAGDTVAARAGHGPGSPYWADSGAVQVTALRANFVRVDFDLWYSKGGAAPWLYRAVGSLQVPREGSVSGDLDRDAT
jgi:hypothetical protein